ncbi:MAG: glycoside hydrolase family 3 C-terminal domain-containing protein [Actinomycetales bacterium]|nr:glycoside hydrolase family 3 C-terminal domain-containing protein [Actinomycetales bacterium]
MTETTAPGVAPWADRALPLDDRVSALVADLAPEELAAMALGDAGPLARRGLPALHYVDAGAGLRGVPGATAFPCGVALGASFDPDLARRVGAAVAGEARAAGFTVLLGPTLDLAVEPRGGRVPEGFGESPGLSGLLGAAYVRGAQGTHLIVQVKHFGVYTSEDRRTGEGPLHRRGAAADVRVTDAALHDLFLRPYESVVRAGAWSMMGAYTRVNGEYACQSSALLSVPRERWGWRGFYCPDFIFAVRDDAAALAAGLDLPALGGPAGRTAEMVAAAPPELVRAIAERVTRALIGSGLADDPVVPQDRPAVVPAQAHADLALEAAVAGAVLLKNDGLTLPLGDGAGRLAVIGPAGDDAFLVVGGSAAVAIDPGRGVPLLAGLRARFEPGVEVVHAQGSWGDVPLTTVPADRLSLPDGSGPGVLVTRDDGTTQIRPTVDHAAAAAGPTGPWPARWETVLRPPAAGRYRFSLALGGSARVRIDGRTVMSGSRELETFIGGPALPLQCTVELTGEPVRVEIAYENGPAIVVPPEGLGPTLRLGWQPPDGLIDEAADLARTADAAVVIVNAASGEGMDRDSLALPGDQDELVARVARANPRTIVVLNTPGPVLMPWIDDVAAVLQLWYPGERGGTALSAILSGDAEPRGRLPLTFPSAAPVPEPDRTRTGEAPVLFPFGHGLSYAATSDAVIGSEARDGELAITLRVRGVGHRDGVHLGQLYADPGGAGRWELVDVARVAVPAGETREATVRLGATAFARWDGDARTPVDGVHGVRVGTSTDDVGRMVEVTVAGGRVVRASPASGPRGGTAQL